MKLWILIGWIVLVFQLAAAYPSSSFDSNQSKLFSQNDLLYNTLIPSVLENFLKKFQSEEELKKAIITNVSDTCGKHTFYWISQIRTFIYSKSQVPDLWALQMVDAFSKPPEGILSGHLNPMGDFDECLGVRANNVNIGPDIPNSFTGKYCSMYITPPPQGDTKTKEIQTKAGQTGHVASPAELIELIGSEGLLFLPSIATCLPSSCSNEEMGTLVKKAFEEMTLKDVLHPTVFYCTTFQKPPLDTADISMIAFLGALIGVCVFAGVVDMALTRGLEKPPRRGLAAQYFFAFSLYTNIRKWLSTRSTGDDLGCVHGIRFMSMAWVILAHTWYMVTFIPQWNMVDAKRVHEDWSIMFVLNSTYSVDVFFILSGMLVSYNLLKLLDKNKGMINIPMFYLHRYLRLTPTYAILVGIMATLIPYLGSGPFWEWMERWSQICVDNWWTNLLYVNNFVNTNRLCQGEAWYLADDMQFYILSPLFIYPLWRWPKYGIGFLSISTFASILCPTLQIYFLDTVTPTTIPTRFNAVEQGIWFEDIYIKPYSRIQTYLVGVALGWILFKKRGKKVYLSKLVQLIGWTVSTCSTLAILFAVFPWFNPNNEIPRIPGSLYGGLGRFGFGVSVSWVIFACVKGYGGLINDFLSWKIFMPLGRLCFCTFLVSLHLQMALHLSLKQAISYDPYTMMNLYLAHMVVSLFVGFVCTLTMESPFIIVEKLIFEGPSKPPSEKRLTQNTQQHTPPNERYGIFYQKQDISINANEVHKTGL